MTSNNNPLNNSSGGQVSSCFMGGNSLRASMYLAFEDYERQARQRKYQIADYEDTIENLKKELKAVTEKNKAMEADCDKMEIAAQAAEAHYEKKVKEKQLMENQYRELAKEMDEVMDEVTRKKDRLKFLKLFHHEKVDQAKTLYEKYMCEYMKNPNVAQLVGKTKEANDLEAVLKEKKQELELRKRERQELKNKHDEEWRMFEKKCVKLAEIRSELKKKFELHNKLVAEYQRPTPGTPNIAPPRSTQMPETPSTSTSSSKRRALFPLSSGSRGIGMENTSISPRKRSSTFQKLDRILYQSHAVLGSPNYQRITSIGSFSNPGNSNWKNFCSPMRNGSTLVSQLKSKLKGTVHPMPRIAQVESSSNQSANIATITPIPIESETRARANNTEPTSFIPKEPEVRQIVVGKPQHENVSACTEPLFLPQLSNQPNVLGNSEQMEIRMLEGSGGRGMPVNDTINAESNEITNVGHPTVISSDKSKEIPETVPPAVETNFFGSFAPSSPTPSSGSVPSTGDFFGGLFGVTTSQATKSPDFNFMF